MDLFQMCNLYYFLGRHSSKIPFVTRENNYNFISFVTCQDKCVSQTVTVRVSRCAATCSSLAAGEMNHQLQVQHLVVSSSTEAIHFTLNCDGIEKVVINFDQRKCGLKYIERRIRFRDHYWQSFIYNLISVEIFQIT